MILAQLSVYPIGEGVSMGRFVRKGVKIIEESGYTYQVGGMSTSIEVPDLQDLFDLVGKIRQAQLDEGAERIIIELKVDDRKDKKATLASKIDSVTAG
ncbi:MAG: MTH1187 family thiamine-binding protein [Desulfobacterales bacterium]|nr:MTH1187 family thiamine-binding protein [Deltaproteobacteria bacterium]NNK97305.1 MTH1187 family thiamine-binding protein [Desulfobacterales bacterium]